MNRKEHLVCYFFSVYFYRPNIFFIFENLHFVSVFFSLSVCLGQLVIDSEENVVHPETRGAYGTSCTTGRICVPITDCSVLYYEAAKTCFAGDRSMFCGGTQYEPYICCPKNPSENNRQCGKSLVSGQFYKGLGAFPFVARIGFKSEFTLMIK